MTYSGGGNFEGLVIPISNPGGRDYKQIAITHEYLLVYAKSDLLELNELAKEISFSKTDSLGGYELRELRNRNPKFHSGNRPNLFYSYFVNPQNMIDSCCPVSLERTDDFKIEVKPYNSAGSESIWRWGKQKASENIIFNDIDKSQIVARQKADGNWNIYEKNRRETSKAKSVWNETFMRTEDGTRLIRDLFDGKSYFDHPKSIELIKRSVLIGSNKHDIILDFFSGSATTAHAVMKLNAEDGGNRRYIMVQLPEKTPEDHEARKAGYETIAEIGKERIRRAGEKIKEEFKDKEGIENLDIGFKVFKLNESNFTAWNTNTSDLTQTLSEMKNTIMGSSSSEDAFYEVLLKLGIDISLPVEEIEIKGKKIYSLAGHYVLACFDKNLSLDIIEEMARLSSETETIVVSDDVFKDNLTKLNAEETLKRNHVKFLRVV